MEHVWAKVEKLRGQFEVLREDRIPIDVLTFCEVDIGLNPIPFDDLTAKYQVEAAITADFSGIYIDAEQYVLMERGPEWKLKRLRFSIAHELAHYFLHRDLPQPANFASLPDFARWNASYDGRKYTIEQEANEFAGRLLVPETVLRQQFEEFTDQIAKIVPGFIGSSDLRDKFAERAAPKFMVNAQVIAVRLDRDQIWPAA